MLTRSVVGLLVLSGCVTPAAPPPEPLDGSVPEPFIALSRDFEGFESWESTEIGDETFPGEAEGPRVIYRSEPPAGAAYPVGAILVKVITPSDDPTTWEIIAMAKRGAGFNPMGAKNWEWFRLVLVDGAPTISWRGESPPLGMGYSLVPDSGITGACNTCHGLFPDHDYILDEPFRPSSP